MLIELLIGLASKSGTPAPVPAEEIEWECTNQVEVWCDEEGCSARPDGEFTPMSITATEDGALEVCAYTGCWQGGGVMVEQSSRLLWTASKAPFSSSPEQEGVDLTLLIDRHDGVGFVRAGGIATPLQCNQSK